MLRSEDITVGCVSCLLFLFSWRSSQIKKMFARCSILCYKPFDPGVLGPVFPIDVRFEDSTIFCVCICIYYLA